MCAKTPPPPAQSGPPAPAAPPAQEPAEAPEPNKPLDGQDARRVGTTQLVNKPGFIPSPNVGSGVGTSLVIPA